MPGRGEGPAVTMLRWQGLQGPTWGNPYLVWEGQFSLCFSACQLHISGSPDDSPGGQRILGKGMGPLREAGSKLVAAGGGPGRSRNVAQR